jgi:D-glucosaminate PTS system EIIB component
VHLVNVRIDDRLLHGQVVYNWLRVLEPDIVMIVSTGIFDLQRELFRVALPKRYDLWLGTVGQAVEYLSTLDENPLSILVLVTDVWQVQELVRVGVTLPTVTLGSQGWRPGRTRITSQVSLAPEEVEVLQSLSMSGLKIVFQALPCDVTVPWSK